MPWMLWGERPAATTFVSSFILLAPYRPTGAHYDKERAALLERITFTRKHQVLPCERDPLYFIELEQLHLI